MRKLKRMTALVLVCVLALGMTGTANAASPLPAGVWKYFNPYSEALQSNDFDRILETGDALLTYCDTQEMTVENALDGLYFSIYKWRFENRVFELRGDYDAAIENVQKLLEIAKWQEEHGKDRWEWLISGEANLRKLDPHTQVYALTSVLNEYPSYGAMYEPASGTYIGRVLNTMGNDYDNEASIMANDALVSIYVDPDREGGESAADYAWCIDPFDDGNHLIHIAFNFTNEADTAQAVLDGKLDQEIEETLNYIATLKSPVFLRIGAEMNVWSDKIVEPDIYRNAYIYIAKQVRQIAPNAALVFSPNFVSRFGKYMEDYYPGDEYVDWVGVSLYMKKIPGQKDDVSLCGGIYNDAILNISEVVDKFGDKKPIFVTEGGSPIADTDIAVEEVTEMYAALNMVYPQVKAIIYYDTKSSKENATLYDNYVLDENSAIRAAYDEAVKGNKSLLTREGTSAPVYMPLSEYSEARDTLELAAFSETLYGVTMQVTYTMDGKKLSSGAGVPYRCNVDIASLSTGEHTLTVSFDDGAGYKAEKLYTITKAADGSVSAKEYFKDDEKVADPAVTAFMQLEDVRIGENTVNFQMYQLRTGDGSGTNYVRIRDVAYALRWTASRFEVDWEKDKGIIVTTNHAYTENGSENAAGYFGDRNYTQGTAKTYVNGKQVELVSISIPDANGNGDTYYQLRDLGRALGFNVGWSKEDGVYLEPGVPYNEAN